MSSFAIYLIGTIIVTAGLALAAYKLNTPPIWIVIGVIIIIGMGVMVGVSKTKLKEKSETDK